MPKERVLVYVPTLNEEKTVRKLVEEISAKYSNYDIIVVDDHSDDETIKEVQRTKARILPMPINTKGNGTIVVAFLVAKRGRYDYLVKIDGDGQQEVDSIDNLLLPLRKNEADITVGSRYIKKVPETDSFLKVVGRVVSSSLVNFKLKGKNRITDCTSGLRAWNSNSIEKLGLIYETKPLSHNSTFWIYETILATKNNLKIKEISAFYKKRKFGKSKSFSLTSMFFFPFRLLYLLIL